MGSQIQTNTAQKPAYQPSLSTLTDPTCNADSDEDAKKEAGLRIGVISSSTIGANMLTRGRGWRGWSWGLKMQVP